MTATTTMAIATAELIGSARIQIEWLALEAKETTYCQTLYGVTVTPSGRCLQGKTRITSIYAAELIAEAYAAAG